MSGQSITEEGVFKTNDGKELYTKTWKPAGEVKAYLVFVHGFSDHSNRYSEWFPYLTAKGIEVHAWDQRGWGRSVSKPAEKGLTGPTQRVLDDMSDFIRPVLSEAKSTRKPLFLMGHSMGGAETLTYIGSGPKEITSQIRGYLVEGPWIALHPKTQPNAFTVIAGRLASKVLPHHQMVNALDVKLISRDVAVQEDYKADELCHDTGTLEGLAGALDRAGDLSSGKTVIPPDAGEGGKTRVWFSHGTADGVCDFDATKNLYDRLQGWGVEDKEAKWYEGYYHQLHADLPGEDRIDYANDVAAWILARADGPGGTGPPRAKL